MLSFSPPMGESPCLRISGLKIPGVSYLKPHAPLWLVKELQFIPFYDNIHTQVYGHYVLVHLPNCADVRNVNEKLFFLYGKTCNLRRISFFLFFYNNHIPYSRYLSRLKLLSTAFADYKALFSCL